METLNVYKERLDRAIEKYPIVNNLLIDLEKKTNVQKMYIAYGNQPCYIIFNAEYLLWSDVLHRSFLMQLKSLALSVTLRLIRLFNNRAISNKNTDFYLVLRPANYLQSSTNDDKFLWQFNLWHYGTKIFSICAHIIDQIFLLGCPRRIRE